VAKSDATAWVDARGAAAQPNVRRKRQNEKIHHLQEKTHIRMNIEK